MSRRKRVISLLITVVMLVTMLTVPTSAVEVERDELFITEEVAYYLAEFFVRDMVDTEQTIWDENTSIEDTEIMYDETGEKVNGYTFKLTDGYVVVSAYLDVPNIILEWADEAVPVYEEAEVDEDNKIIYLGTMDYYIDDGEQCLKTIQGDEVPRDELSNTLEEMRDENYVEDGLLEELDDLVEAPSTGITTFVANNRPGGFITDPYAYAKYLHGGSWVVNNYSNEWESYTNFAVSKDAITSSGTLSLLPCGPIAITNIIKMVGRRHGISSINADNSTAVFRKVLLANSGVNNGYYSPNGSIIGADRLKAAPVIKMAFDLYGESVIVSTQQNLNYSRMIASLNKSNCLMYLSFNASSNHAYERHAVAGYAYTRIRKTDYSKYMAFIKIADGENYGARYIELETIAAANGQYYEVIYQR